MSEISLHNQIPIKTILSKKAKRIGVRIRSDFSVELIIPRSGNIKEAQKFLDSKMSWIKKHLEKHKQIPKLEKDEIMIFGQTHKIIVCEKKIYDKPKLWVEEQQLFLQKCIQDSEEELIQNFLLEKIASEIHEMAFQISQKYNLTYKKIRINNNKSSWGTCSRQGVLSFCWRLVFAPKEVIRYVVVHELAHLKQMNHSKKFWNLVESMDPNYKTHIKWLKKHASLSFVV